MLGYSPFYNETIKKATIAFGSIFTDMRIVREKNGKKQTVNVPLVYASGDAAINRKYEDPDMKKSMPSTYPRMAYYMNEISYDSARTVASGNTMTTSHGIVTTAPAPYLLTFQLYVVSANFEDGLQIVEQILPFFKPDFTVTTDMFPELGLEYDLVYSIADVQFVDPNAEEVEYTNHRLIEWTFTFHCPINLAITAQEMLEQGSKVIKQTEMQMYAWGGDDYYYRHSIGPTVIPKEANQTDKGYMVHNGYTNLRGGLIDYGEDVMSDSTISIIGYDCGIYKHPHIELSFTEKKFLEKMDNYLKDMIVKLNILPRGKKPTATYDYKTLTLTLGIPRETAPVKGKDYFTEKEIQEIQDKITLQFRNNFVVKYSDTNKALPMSGGVCTWEIQHNIGSKNIVFNVFDSYGNLVTDYSADFIDDNVLRLYIPSKNSIKAKSLYINIIG